QQINKDQLDKTIYQDNNNNNLIMYTAIWCGPCRRIKPDVLKYLEENNYKLLSSEVITKVSYKENLQHKFIPAFYINNNYIQTSDFNTFKKYVEEHKNVDDDF